MPIDPAHVGRADEPMSLLVDAGRLRFFAKATGQADPVYRDEVAAAAAGHPGLPVPPTFMFGIAMEAAEPFGYLTELGVDLGSLLHGTQSFDYHRMAYAGDTLTLNRRISDIYQKKGGALEFVVHESTVTNQRDELVATLLATSVIQHRQGASS